MWPNSHLYVPQPVPVAIKSCIFDLTVPQRTSSPALHPGGAVIPTLGMLPQPSASGKSSLQHRTGESSLQLAFLLISIMTTKLFGHPAIRPSSQFLLHSSCGNPVPCADSGLDLGPNPSLSNDGTGVGAGFGQCWPIHKHRNMQEKSPPILLSELNQLYFCQCLLYPYPAPMPASLLSLL